MPSSPTHRRLTRLSELWSDPRVRLVRMAVGDAAGEQTLERARGVARIEFAPQPSQ